MKQAGVVEDISQHADDEQSTEEQDPYPQYTSVQSIYRQSTYPQSAYEQYYIKMDNTEKLTKEQGTYDRITSA
jgi:hypothetical protein